MAVPDGFVGPAGGAPSRTLTTGHWWQSCCRREGKKNLSSFFFNSECSRVVHSMDTMLDQVERSIVSSRLEFLSGGTTESIRDRFFLEEYSVLLYDGSLVKRMMNRSRSSKDHQGLSNTRALCAVKDHSWWWWNFLYEWCICAENRMTHEEGLLFILSKRNKRNKWSRRKWSRYIGK